MDTLEELHPLFIGAYAENADLLEALVVDFLRDHVYWRRNFHPENTPPIPTSARYREANIQFRARLEQELRSLSSDLKRSVPFFSPRYVGHMASDLLLPGMIAKIITTLYNPNNVAEEASPATLRKELEVGDQLAQMVGYDTSSGAAPRAWGHLTSGGTVANYEGLRNITAARLWPLALRSACRRHPQVAARLLAQGLELEREGLAWLSFSVDEAVALRGQVEAALRSLEDAQLRQDFWEDLEGARVESLGLIDFFAEHSDVPPPRVLVPVTAHYSWAKAMKILGWGKRQLVSVPTDAHMRMKPEALREALADLEARGVPVLCVVGVLGTTEFGTIDPLGEIFALQRQCAARGQVWSVHVDAAWGGYLATLFRRPDGGVYAREVLRKQFHYFPSQAVYDAFTSLHLADSITIDPHKLGYIPYAAGAYVGRNRGVIDFLAQGAAYVFDIEAEPQDLDQRVRHLGQYILEGSKPGSSVAAVHVTHKVVPLHGEGFGRVLRFTVMACEYFNDALEEWKERMADRVRVTVPIMPDTNLICLALNPVGNRSLPRVNQFTRRVFGQLNIDAALPVQGRDFIASYTSIFRSNLGEEAASAMIQALGVAPESFVARPQGSPEASDHLFVLRHTLMNPWLLFEEEGRNYIDRYLDTLERVIDGELARGGL